MNSSDTLVATTTHRNIPCRLIDGTVLSSVLVEPKAPGKYPVLLSRTPYNAHSDGSVEKATRLAERGFITIIQDVRGRFASEGEYYGVRDLTYKPESDDGVEAVAWAAGLPNSNGHVGTIGHSYLSWTQWAMAHRSPPGLKAMFAQGSAANLLDRHIGGVPMIGRWIDWVCLDMAVGSAEKLGIDGFPKSKEESRRRYVEVERHKWLWHLPLTEVPEHAMPGMRQYWQHLLSTAHLDTYGFERHHPDIKVPVLHSTGWYDQQIGTIGHFTGIRKNAKSKFARENQYLIVGPWGHTDTRLGQEVGALDFGVNAVRDYFSLAGEWFGHWLREDGRPLDWPRVQVFVMGRNRWRNADDWPIPSTRFISYYFTCGRSDAAALGLSAQRPAEEAPTQYTYDPRDPVMTIYGQDAQRAPLDQSPLAARDDVLGFETAPLEHPIEVTGPIEIVLYASSSAEDTDFTAQLIDVFPDGFWQELTHGIVRCCYRDSYESPQAIVPGRVYELRIKLHPTSNEFQPGHRIRVNISSSNFPQFDRNHNTGEEQVTSSTLQTAHQTIFHDRARPSHIILPVIDND